MVGVAWALTCLFIIPICCAMVLFTILMLDNTIDIEDIKEWIEWKEARANERKKKRNERR